MKATDEHYEVSFFVLGAGGLLTCFMLIFGVSIPPPLKSAIDENRPPMHRASTIMYIRNKTLNTIEVVNLEDGDNCKK